VADAAADGSQGGAPGRLVFRDPPPQPTLRRRDPHAALAFRDVAEEKGREALDQLGSAGDDDLMQQVQQFSWYHTIELPGGVVTPGQFDHRELLARYGFPERMDGLRALDVATFNGFWAFHMESLGADVTAIDLDDPRQWDFPTQVRPLVEQQGEQPAIGRGFEIASRALGSKVRRVGRSVYDLDPDVDGTFDFVHAGDVLVHLREPLRALERIRAVTTGTLLLSDGIDLDLGRGGFGPATQYLGGWDDVVWWVPSLDALAQMVIDAGFRDVHVNSVYNLAKTYETQGFWRASLTATV
jgi:tRNA (mo5U34)-methyltransferase